MTPPRLRVAVVGVGYLGAIHARIYHAMRGVELVAVVDTDAATAATVAAECGCAVLPSVAALAGKVDAASVAVPTSAHASVAKALLRRGIHLLLEKPIAPGLAEARAIVRAADRAGVILQIGHLERFNAGVMKLAELARQPRFIEVHRLGAFVERATDVDVVTDLMIHDIDIVLSLMPVPLRAIHASGARVLTAHVDIANARLEFAGGAVANVTASRVSRAQFRRIRVFGADGYLGLNFTDQQLDRVRVAAAKPGARFGRLIQRRIAVAPQPPLDAELAHFIDCVRHGRRPLVTGEDGLTALAVAHKVRRKIAQSTQPETIS